MDSKEDQLIPKVEPIDVDCIKKEKTGEEECFVIPGIVESLNSVKEEKEEIENYSSTNVCFFSCYSFLSYYTLLKGCIIEQCTLIFD